jgi:hypothetical protein
MISKKEAIRLFERLSQFQGYSQLTAAAADDFVETIRQSATYEIGRQVISDFQNDLERDWIPKIAEIKTGLQREADRRNPALFRSRYRLHPDCSKCGDTGWVRMARTAAVWPGHPMEYSGVSKCTCKHAPPDRREEA